ncbi:MAG TPA: hypothetical protein GXX41_02005 [Thermoanaerobacterium sp.]|nr:hypothetical protein [Thermoanaerobacterium sp.]
MQKENIIIFSPALARKLIKMGFQIIDIKPDKINPVKSVFVFKRNQAIVNELLRYKQKRHLA